MWKNVNRQHVEIYKVDLMLLSVSNRYNTVETIDQSS